MAALPEFFPDVSGFEWDAGNSEKIWRRHRVSQVEAEQILFNRPILVAPDLKHSEREVRHLALGQTDAGRSLLVEFTVRGSLVRVISARPMNRRERRIYGKAANS